MGQAAASQWVGIIYKSEDFILGDGALSDLESLFLGSLGRGRMGDVCNVSCWG